MPLADAHSYALWVNAVIFAAAAACVWLAGTRLVAYLSRIGDITGLEQALVGMLLLGFLTSLPEVANVVTSSYFGNPALAVNNLLGSASINVLLLAMADAAIGRDALTAVIARPSTLMQAALCMLVLTLVAIAVSSGDLLISGVGLWPVSLFGASIAALWLSARYGRHAPWALRGAERLPKAAGRDAQAGGAAGGSLRRLILKTTVAAAIIFVAGYSLAQTGDALARQTGLGTGMVGFLLIGFATSMPELSTITAALRMRRHEMALAEILGTNFVNISLILLADGVFTGGAVIDELGRFEVISSLLGVLLTGAYLVGLLEHRNPVFLRMGYDSLAVMLLFAGGVALLFAVR